MNPQRLRFLHCTILTALLITASALIAQSQEPRDVTSSCAAYELPVTALIGRTTTVAFAQSSFCMDCEAQSWKRCEDALKVPGANSCDCTYAYLEYCGQQCPSCRHCGLQLYFYRDTGCP